MQTLWGDRQRFCDGITRRNFLRIGAFGAGLSLAEVLRQRAVAGAGAATTGRPSCRRWWPAAA